jgi:hypothetical protein
MSDGSILTTVSGGIPPYNYLWSTGETGPSVTGLPTGTYQLTVTDANSSTQSGEWIIAQPEELMWTGYAANVTCHGENDGAVIGIGTMGGTPPYSYLWSTGATTESITGLGSDYYYLTVSDAHNCTAMYERYVFEPPVLAVVSADVAPAACPTSLDGSVTGVIVSGGNPPYSYLWSNGATTTEISGLNPGTYTVTVTDEKSCLVDFSWIVGQTSAVCQNTIVTGDITTMVCYDAINTITVAGGTTTFIVEPAGHATFIAGSKIRYLEGTKVMSGGYMLGKITLTNEFCSAAKMTEVAGGKVETPLVTERSFFSLFPNPTNGNFTLVQKGDRNYRNVKVEVYSMSGEKVLADGMIGETKHEFRITDMPAGLYFVKVVADDYVETIKLVKVK